MKKNIFWVLLFGFLIRLIALDQSLWLDEAVTANVVKNFSYSQIITKFSPTDFHPPLYYLFMKFWTDIFGYSEISIRFPSIIFSLLTAWVIYLVGKKFKGLKELKGFKGLRGESLGAWAAALFLFNPLIIYYSQEARPYMLVTMFITLIVYYLLRINELTNYELKNNKTKRHPELDSGSGDNRFQIKFGMTKKTPRMTDSVYIRYLLLVNFFILLSFLTFYGSIFFIAAIYLWLLFKKQFKLFLHLVPGFVLAGILVAPLFLQQYANSQIALSTVANWDLVLGKANLKNLLLIPVKFSIGRISFEPKFIYWLIAGLWTTLIFSLTLRPKTHLRGVYLWLFFGPLALGFVVSFFTPVLQYFRFIYLIPIFVLLIALAASKKTEPTKSHIARPARSGNWQGWGVLAGFLAFSFIYLLNPAYHREDWKSLVKNLNTKSVYMIPSSSDPVKYYNKNIKVNDLRSIENIQEKEITVIPYTAEIHGINYRKVLSSKYYVLSMEKSYRELKLEYWKLKN